VRKNVMRTRFKGILSLLLLVPLVLLAGCAAERSYQGHEPEYSSTSEIPPSWYNYNPQYEQWFSAPYWMPEIGP
jgi:hypothetical protein